MALEFESQGERDGGRTGCGAGVCVERVRYLTIRQEIMVWIRLEQ